MKLRIWYKKKETLESAREVSIGAIENDFQVVNEALEKKYANRICFE